MNPVNNLISENLIQALGWTLIHSLWQGAIIAVLLALSLIVLRKNSSKARYFISTSALVMLFLTSVFTFTSAFQNFSPSKDSQRELAGGQTSTQMVGNQTVYLELPENKSEELGFDTMVDFFSGYFNQHLPLIVTIWLLGVMVLMLRFLGAFAYLQRLKHYRTKSVSDYWQTKVILLANQLNLSKMIRLVESGVVKVPMTIGFFKPVILLPIGTLSGLSVEQVESILAHELAHIYRNDYLVNLVQSVVEILLFFNPAMWWISSCIREERENCCDDIAISLTKDNITFARTLATLEEMRLTGAELAMAFADKKGFLLNRIKRLVNNKSVNATFSEGFWTACILLMLVFSASYQANAGFMLDVQDSFQQIVTSEEGKVDVEKKQQSNEIEQVDEEKDNSAQFNAKTLHLEDTIRWKNFMLVSQKDGKVLIFKDGNLIPETDYNQYEKEFEISDNKVRIGEEGAENNPITIAIDNNSFRTRNSSHIGYRTDNNRATWFVMPPIPPMVHLPFLHKLPNMNNDVVVWDNKDEVISIVIDGKNIDLKNIADFKDKVEKLKSKRRKGKDGFSYSFDFRNDESFEQQWEEYGKQMEEYGEEVSKYAEEYAKKYEERMKRFEVEDKEYSEEYKARMEEYEEDKERQEQNMEKILSEMENDALIKDSQNYNITIKKGRMSVNNKNLEGALFEKYKKLFDELFDFDISSPDTNWQINVNED